jgi:hypothetical protein
MERVISLSWYSDDLKIKSGNAIKMTWEVIES